MGSNYSLCLEDTIPAGLGEVNFFFLTTFFPTYCNPNIHLILYLLYRFRDVLNHLVAKADAERQGRSIEEFPEDKMNELSLLRVEIIDGYHRFGALMMLINNPYELVEKSMDVDWAAAALRYPEWVKLDRLSSSFVHLNLHFFCEKI